MVQQVSVLEDPRHGSQGVLPRVDLGVRRIVSIMMKEGVLELAGDLVQDRIFDELPR
jgi:hypothetical protein